MRSQNCPVCKGSATADYDINISEGDRVLVYCDDPVCDMNDGIEISIWNRLRLAPDDKPMHWDTNAGYFSWMDPIYPEEKK